MLSLRLLPLAFLLIAAPALAQAPAPVAAPPQDKPAVEEERPDFQPLRPAEPDEPAAAAPAPPPPSSTPSTVAPVQPSPSPPPVVVQVPVVETAPPAAGLLPAWAMALLLVTGAMLAGLFGITAARSMRRAELAERRRATAACLAAELETRRLAFDAVPLPPNVDAGVSFVSAVISMAGIDCAFRTAQGSLFLLSPQLAAHISVHYAAVQRVADFVKGQSLAAAVRMLQANRLGGHPCPDAGAMREAHVELAAAFRGLDKVILSLNALQR
ncbi:hypothetical protein [Magnetospirillum gryphiswaldense]|uniref:Secreted protein n=1 Tax=Magnetospirillum gryphiswaldense TaxID=55518 RepID=A4U5G4_9PROT|nr:hypothetical protein [Magnetospirillum gryphiswaldense]AVM72941.1 hypothetical protein MSR1_04290 [Magnetospirillum gryphiswaldense MSR-1]AVM76844.1 hypothetical protein MSR1L_04290 [Magnetospirillum gryphiswaldense]CAM78121.1 hypothetical protein MGR_4189 [Magnetospirillum gryphiswaldense MSR-1]